MRRELALLAAPTCMVLCGCAHTENERATIGESLCLAAFTERDGAALPPDAPSVTGLDRSSWREIRFDVPVNTVAHPPRYARSANLVTNSPRRRGEHPTPESALDLDNDGAACQATQTPWIWGNAAVDGALIAPGLVVQPQWRTKHSPLWAYERAPVAQGGEALASACDGDGCCAKTNGCSGCSQGSGESVELHVSAQLAESSGPAGTVAPGDAEVEMVPAMDPANGPGAAPGGEG